MDNKAKTKMWRIVLLSSLCFGFVGAIISGCITAVVYGDNPPDIGAIVIIILFIVIMLSSLLFLIPFRKSVFSGNGIILNEYGTPESKVKTYELYYSGFEVLENNAVNINAKIKHGFLFRSPRISRMYFSPLAFSTNGFTRFQWGEVNKIEIENKQIKIFLCNGGLVILPCQKNIAYLIKTFCSKEIENEKGQFD